MTLHLPHHYTITSGKPSMCCVSHALARLVRVHTEQQKNPILSLPIPGQWKPATCPNWSYTVWEEECSTFLHQAMKAYHLLRASLGGAHALPPAASLNWLMTAPSNHHQHTLSTYVRMYMYRCIHAHTYPATQAYPRTYIRTYTSH